jgi:hypothetical protein
MSYPIPESDQGSDLRFVTEFPGIKVYKGRVMWWPDTIIASTENDWWTIIWYDDEDIDEVCEAAPQGAVQFRAYIAMQNLPGRIQS